MRISWGTKFGPVTWKGHQMYSGESRARRMDKRNHTRFVRRQIPSLIEQEMEETLPESTIIWDKAILEEAYHMNDRFDLYVAEIQWAQAEILYRENTIRYDTAALNLIRGK